jgi:formate-dependent nitrite reductase membrane component NrfD
LQKTWMPTIAGLLCLISGAIGILGSLILIVLVNLMINSQDYLGQVAQYFRNPVIWMIFVLYFVFCGIAIAGGTLAIKRKVWGIALAGGICSLLTIWGYSLGIASITFLVLSKSEFGIPAASVDNTSINTWDL